MIGRTISHYEIVSQIGAGGMGTVYRARDTLLGRFVAIKVLPADAMRDESRQRRFLQEARAASALNHPNIITIYDVLHVDDVHAIVMELLEGQSLQRGCSKDRCHRNRRSVPRGRSPMRWLRRTRPASSTVI